jgi:hypothetical protein
MLLLSAAAAIRASQPPHNRLRQDSRLSRARDARAGRVGPPTKGGCSQHESPPRARGASSVRCRGGGRSHRPVERHARRIRVRKQIRNMVVVSKVAATSTWVVPFVSVTSAETATLPDGSVVPAKRQASASARSPVPSIIAAMDVRSSPRIDPTLSGRTFDEHRPGLMSSATNGGEVYSSRDGGERFRQFI